MYDCTSIAGTPGAPRRREPVRRAVHRSAHRWPTSDASPPNRRGDDVAHTSRDRWLYPPLSRRSSVVGGRGTSGGSGYYGYVHDTRKRAVVSVGHICSSNVVIGTPPPPPVAYNTPFRPPVISVIVWRVCQDRLPPCLCIIDVLSNGRNKREKKYTHTPAHYAIVTAAVVTILRLYIVHKARTLLFPHPDDPFSRRISHTHVARDRSQPVSTQNVGITITTHSSARQ